MHKGALRKWRRVLAEQIFGASDIWRHFFFYIALMKEITIKGMIQGQAPKIFRQADQSSGWKFFCPLTFPISRG
jgi:hypothetical protein